MCRTFPLLGLLAVLVFAPAVRAQTPWVAIDIGHSLAARGAKAASGRHEFAFNRDLGRALHEALGKRGIRHKLIGEDGAMEDLHARTPAAAGAALFISLHHDSVQAHLLPDAAQYQGYSLLISHRNIAVEKSLTCATHLGDAILAIGRAPTLHHAAPIPGENHEMADRARGIYWYDDLVVLRTAQQPAVLIEAAVIVNPKEERLAASPRFQREMAGAIAQGIAACLKTFAEAEPSTSTSTPAQ